MISAILFLTLCPQASPEPLYDFRDTLDAIRVVETGGCPQGGEGARGDYRTVKGKRVAMALGPFQIWEPYHRDAAERDKTLTSHKSCLMSTSYSERVVRAYMNRYARTSLRRLEAGTGTIRDVEIIARIHNGGPAANRVDRIKLTDGYWAKVKKEVNR